MKVDIDAKIENLLKNGPDISEDQVRSLMALFRKRIESMTESDKQKYLVLKLFCDWSLHNQIDQSNTGLRTLAKVNDALVVVKNSKDSHITQTKLSESIGYVALRREIKLFLKNCGLDQTRIQDNNTWGQFLTHLIEIIRDVPLSFPSVVKLDKTKQKIYNQIAQNALGPKGGVMMMQIIKIDYGQLGLPNGKELFSLHAKLENTTNIIVPLLLDVNLN